VTREKKSGGRGIAATGSFHAATASGRKRKTTPFARGNSRVDSAPAGRLSPRRLSPPEGEACRGISVSDSSSAHLRAALQALFVTGLWSTSWVLIKIGLRDLPPLTFAGLRYGLAFLCLLPFVLHSSHRKVLRGLANEDSRRRRICAREVSAFLLRPPELFAPKHTPDAPTCCQRPSH